MDTSALETERLVLRPLEPGDIEWLSRLNQDPAVMEHFPAPLNEEETRRQLARLLVHRELHGFGTWVALCRKTAQPLGAFGLHHVSFGSAFAPAIEVSWRLASTSWGQGYATEAAARVLQFGFEQLKLERIVGFTAATNRRSLAVFARLGMERDERFDFEHPKLPPGHPLRPHLFFRAGR